MVGSSGVIHSEATFRQLLIPRTSENGAIYKPSLGGNNANGVASSSPRLARKGLPWETPPPKHQPQRGCAPASGVTRRGRALPSPLECGGKRQRHTALAWRARSLGRKRCRAKSLPPHSKNVGRLSPPLHGAADGCSAEAIVPFSTLRGITRSHPPGVIHSEATRGR